MFSVCLSVFPNGFWTTPIGSIKHSSNLIGWIGDIGTDVSLTSGWRQTDVRLTPPWRQGTQAWRQGGVSLMPPWRQGGVSLMPPWRQGGVRYSNLSNMSENWWLMDGWWWKEAKCRTSPLRNGLVKNRMFARNYLDWISKFWVINL